MKKVIALHGKNIAYEVRVSQRARLLRLTVKRSGEIFLTMPHGMKLTVAEKFIEEKSNWLERVQNYYKIFQGKVLLDYSKQNFLIYKEKAQKIAEERVAYFNKLYGFKIGKVTIRNQKRRWGSCSRNGNLSFNYKIALMPKHLADYIVVHELCHLDQLNHSNKFWDLVSQTLSNYRELRSNFS